MTADYRHRAAECLRLANEPTSFDHRPLLLEMAQAWILLDVQAEKNSHSDLSYETTPPRESVPQPQQQQQAQQQHQNGAKPRGRRHDSDGRGINTKASST
jgi:hypothetical protein